MSALVLVDCEAIGPCPSMGELTEFGAVVFRHRESFHGVLVESRPDPKNPAKPELVPGGRRYDAAEVFRRFDRWLGRVADGGYVTFVSDNPAYDWQWINDGFWRHIGRNPFGHSARRIGDFYAGLVNDFTATQAWKGLRQTPHTHNPVDDAMGNAEALERLMLGERPERRRPRGGRPWERGPVVRPTTDTVLYGPNDIGGVPTDY